MDGQLLMISGIPGVPTITAEQQKDVLTIAMLRKKQASGILLTPQEMVLLATAQARFKDPALAQKLDQYKPGLMAKVQKNWKKLAVVGIGTYLLYRFTRKS